MTDRSMWGGDGYDLLMGRWSRQMGPLLAEFADVRDGDACLDVGCGTGSLTRALLDCGPAVRVTGIDGSADYVGIARKNIGDDRAELEQGDARSLPYPDDGFDRSLALLVMNFIPDPIRAVEEMKRVTRPGGTVAAAVWDYGDGMEMLRHLWDEAAALDECAVARHEGNMPLCRRGELAALWKEAGLRAVDDTALTIRTTFGSFDEFWTPFLTGVGPSGSYVAQLEPSMQTRLKARLRDKLAGGDASDGFGLSARAWAVRGRVARGPE